MSDKEEIVSVYKKLYTASIEKDAEMIRQSLSKDYVLVHMTGMRQSAKEYIQAVLNGTLNYFSANHASIDVSIIDAEHATIDGKSIVSAAVFGGGKHTWRLRQRMKLIREEDRWKISESVASAF